MQCKKHLQILTELYFNFELFHSSYELINTCENLYCMSPDFSLSDRLTSVGQGLLRG